MKSTSTALLDIILERDMEEPDDPHAWLVVHASLAPMPARRRKGYSHEPDCLCRDATSRRLCDVGWLEEFVSQVEAKDLVPEEIPEGAEKMRLTGRLISVEIGGIEGGDYDEYFEIERAETDWSRR